jgi:hypothetical protein
MGSSMCPKWLRNGMGWDGICRMWPHAEQEHPAAAVVPHMSVAAVAVVAVVAVVGSRVDCSPHQLQSPSSESPSSESPSSLSCCMYITYCKEEVVLRYAFHSPTLGSTGLHASRHASRHASTPASTYTYVVVHPSIHPSIHTSTSTHLSHPLHTSIPTGHGLVIPTEGG